MNWLAPTTALYAAAVTLPLLVLLYFLKLRRRTVPVSSTLLWRRAVQDLHVNAPFQRLRRNILLLMQLLALLAILAALGRPVLSMRGGPGRRCVLLVDRSASMNTVESGVKRLELARQQAKKIVQSLRSHIAFPLDDQSDQAMVVAFDEHAKVMCNFTSDKRQLEEAINAITPTDGSSCISEALTVARAFAQSFGQEANNRATEVSAQLELFSDGKVRDAEGLVVAQGEMNFHSIGAVDENLAVVAMQARRSFEKPDEVEVFATVANFGAHPATPEVQLSLDGNIRSVRSVQVPGRTETAAGKGSGPGKVSLSFSLSAAQGGVLEVRQLLGDALACDDAAWAVLPPPKNISVLLVTAGNAALESALNACPLAKLDVVSPAQFDAMDKAALGIEARYDVIVLDNQSPSDLPRGRFLVFGRPPQASGVRVEGELQNQVVVDWRSRHPVLQFANLINLFASRCHKMVLPADAVVLAEFNTAPALALVRKQGSVYLLAPFDCLETNWPFEPSFVLFCYNAMSYLGTEVAAGQQQSLRVNQAITVENCPPGGKARITGPEIKDLELPVSPAGAVRYPGTSRAGVYSVAVADRPVPASLFAVNLLDAEESDIAPAQQLTFSGQVVPAQTATSQANRELWPLLAAVTLLLVCLEWVVYNLKVRL
jgi:hypothetical protein